MKPLITAISIAIVSASVSAVAAPADNTRTLPVRKADSMPTIAQPSLAKKVSLNVQENRSNSLDSRAPAVATPPLKPKSPDRMTQLIEELRTRGIEDVAVTMTGCLGLCRLEPLVEVIDADGTKVTYVQVDANKAKRIVAEHIVNGKVCTDISITSVEA